jgi:hypothetical protein
MRSGINPGKVSYNLVPFKRHRVILPVFIPHEDGYYKSACEVLRLCLESLCRTTGGRVAITVISNGSCQKATDLIQSFLDTGRIDQVLFNVHNWGKIDSALSVLHGRFEELLTVSDGDVLFLPGWLEAVEQIFMTFPEAGFVTPSPNPSVTYLHTTATLFASLLSRELSRESVVPARDMDLFARSINRPDYFRPEHRASQLVVKRGGLTACVGGGHFVFTLRRDVVDRMPHEPSMMALGSGMTDRFDDPPDAMGAWRLSTTRAYARHMGNTPEPWMYEELPPPADEDGRPAPAEVAAEPASEPSLPPVQLSRFRWMPLPWRKRVIAAWRKSLRTARRPIVHRLEKPGAATK